MSRRVFRHALLNPKSNDSGTFGILTSDATQAFLEYLEIPSLLYLKSVDSNLANACRRALRCRDLWLVISNSAVELPVHAILTPMLSGTLSDDVMTQHPLIVVRELAVETWLDRRRVDADEALAHLRAHCFRTETRDEADAEERDRLVVTATRFNVEWSGGMYHTVDELWEAMDVEATLSALPDNRPLRGLPGNRTLELLMALHPIVSVGPLPYLFQVDEPDVVNQEDQFASQLLLLLLTDRVVAATV